MNISVALSNKIKILSFCSIFAVVWMHAYYLESERWQTIYFLQKYIALFADYAVPLFFTISGFLFFANFDSNNILSFFFSKIKKRINSLILPYFIWCTLFIVIIFIIGFFTDYKTDYFSYCKQGKWGEFVSYVYFTPAAFHLWFVRDLFIIVLCSPAIYMFVRYLPKYIQMICLCLLGIFQFIPIISWGLFWFTIGAMFSLNKKDIFYFIKPKLAILYLCVFCVIVAYFVMSDISLASDRPYAVFVILLGVVGVWRGSDYLCSFDTVSSITHYTFFIYCSHIPLLNIIKTIIYPKLLDSNIGCILGFIIAPVITISICLIVGKLLRTKLFRIYCLISGGR